MRTTRLNKTLREAAMVEVSKRITTPEETERRMQQEIAVRDYFFRRVIELFPPDDMKVLEKYNECILVTQAHLRIPNPDGGRDYAISLDVPPVSMPCKQAAGWCHLPTDATLRQLATDLECLRRAEAAAKDEKRGKYHAVVRAAVTVEELVEIIPYLESVLVRKQAAPLSVLTQSWISEIREDALHAMQGVDTPSTPG